jgi:thiosulfate dehydrogenase (quinone)
MADKFQTAMPGALLGTDHLISFMLQHFWLLYAGVILFSALFGDRAGLRPRGPVK